MSPLQPFVNWAKAVLDAANGGDPYEPPASSQLRFETTTQPTWTTSNSASGPFSPQTLEPTDRGLQDLICGIVEMEMDAPHSEALIFSKNLVRLIHELEVFEHWVKSPLEPTEILGMHTVMHDVLFELAKRNKGATDVERWEESDRALVDKVLLAVAYVLSWQPYGTAMHFVWTMAKPWFSRLSEVIAVHLENEELGAMWPPLECLKNRVHHFDALLYGYLEGAGSLDPHEDISVSQDDMDAVRMFSPQKNRNKDKE